MAGDYRQIMHCPMCGKRRFFKRVALEGKEAQCTRCKGLSSTGDMAFVWVEEAAPDDPRQPLAAQIFTNWVESLKG